MAADATISVTRSEIRTITAAVAPALGLGSSALLLLRELLDMSNEGDWQAGCRPVVWPSNAFLAMRLGCSVSSARRAMNQLAEAGLITFRDSANYKRHGRRDGDELAAFGIELTILAARAAELRQVAADHAAARRRTQDLANEITAARRSIRASLELAAVQELPGAWSRFSRRLDVILAAAGGVVARASLGLLERLARALATLRAAVDKSLVSAVNGSNLTTTLAMGDEHIQAYKDPDFVICKEDNRHRAFARSVNSSGAGFAVATPLPAPRLAQPPVREEVGKEGSGATPEPLDLAQVVAACPAVSDFAPRPITSWDAFLDAAAHLPRIAGISETAWSEARAAMGYREAAVAVAIITEKAARSAIIKPGGYLRGMTRKAQAGELRLGATLRNMARAA